MIDTAVVIASWNGKEYLKDCLDSLAKQTYKKFKIILVDNGSEDDSVGYIEENYKNNIFSGRLEIIRFNQNTGFAYGYNAGIKKALGDEQIKYLLILNNDTSLDERCLEMLTDCVQKNPEAGSIQPKILNFFEKNKIDCAGILLSADGVATNRGYGERDHGQYDEEAEIFGANGTASLFTREVLERIQIKVGEYFDNDFFAYYEDVDLAWRLRLAGFKSYYCPGAKLLHIHSATAKKISGLKAYYLNRNRFFTLIKDYPLGRLLLILFIYSPVRYIFLLYRAIIKKGRRGQDIAGQKKSAVLKEIMRAWRDVFLNLGKLLKKRQKIQKSKKVEKKEVKKWLNEYKIGWTDTF